MRHNSRIARSGVQYYTYAELPSLGLKSVPREFKDLRVFGVYRSAQCLKDAMPLFKGVPIMRGHERWALGGANDPLALGECVETPTLRMHDGEAVITASIELDNDRILDEIKELSPGYVGKYHWQPGVATTGEEFQIVCDKIMTVNHIALVPSARGGQDMKVLDGGKQMLKIKSGLLWFARRKVKRVADGEQADAFISTLEDIKKNRQAWTDEELHEHVNTLSSLVKDLPDSEEKDKLLRFIMDIPLLKEEDTATVEEALNTLREFYSSLDKDAISDIMENGSMDEPTTPDTETKPVDVPVEEQTTAPTQDVQTEDPVYALLIKACEKLDAVLCAVTPKTTEAEPSAENNEPQTNDEQSQSEVPTPEEKVGDQMPIFTQTMDTVNKGNSLDDVFAKMKEHK